MNTNRSSLQIAILTQQISNYHAARYRAAREVFNEVSILSVLNSADFPEFLSDENEGQKICSGKSEYEMAIADGSLWGRVNEALEASSPDVVAVAGWSFPESLAAISWARQNGCGVVIMSASQAHDGERSTWREWIKSRVVKNCHAALVAAEGHKDYIVSLGMRPEAVSLGYDAVDNTYFEYAAEAARENSQAYRAAERLPKRYILASGRFISKKNLPRLIAAFKQALNLDDEGHHLVILGDGPERQSIERAIKENGLEDRVHLPGFRSYDVLPQYYGLSEGFIHVSLAEQWGLVVNEAAAAQLPLIVSNPCGAARTLVHPGENGWLVNPEDVSAISDALSEMMRLTPSERIEMGRASLQIVSDWGPERFASGLKAAAELANNAESSRLRLWDQLLFKKLARMRIQKVS